MRAISLAVALAALLLNAINGLAQPRAGAEVRSPPAVERRGGQAARIPARPPHGQLQPQPARPRPPLGAGVVNDQGGARRIDDRWIRPSPAPDHREGTEMGSRSAQPQVPGPPPAGAAEFRALNPGLRAMQADLERAEHLPSRQQASLLAASHRVETANRVFEARAATMTPRQRALASFQIDAASASIRSAATPGAEMQVQGVRTSVAVADEAEAFSRRIASGSASPRRVTVHVRSAAPERPAKPLAVYVLPLGLMEYGPYADEAQLRNLLNHLRFTEPTSPSHGDVEPGFRYAVWVGPEHEMPSMATLVKTGSPIRFKIVDATAETAAIVTFDESDQIRAR